jgi:elongation factor G
MKVCLVDGDYHDVDSSERAFNTCASMAFKELFRKASPKLLEPIMLVNIVTPAEHIGSVQSDLNARRGRIEDQLNKGINREIKAYVPLAKMFGYATQLRTISRGTATFSMTFDHYEDVPKNVADEVIASRAQFMATRRL